MNELTESFAALFSIEPLSWKSVLACMLSAGIIGFERQIQGKPVGIRTSMLICLGTYVFIVMGAYVTKETSDPSRVVGQVVTGIGFLGAGVMLARDGNITGLTSASCIWVIAAIGVVIGTGNTSSGVKMALLAVFILVGVDRIEASFKRMRRGVHREVPITRLGAAITEKEADSNEV